MQNAIVDHALRNVWCTPDQDNQVIIEPARLTDNVGAMGAHQVMWRKVFLPDNTSRWHVYQIGQIHPLLLGLLTNGSQWVSFADSCNALKMICDIYTNTGVNIPRFDTFYLFNGDKDLIIAVRKNTKLPYNFATDKIFLRLYSNAYFKSDRSDSVNDQVYVHGIKAASTNDITSLTDIHTTYAAKPGQVYSFVNGIKVDRPDLITMAIGDVAEIVYDSSIYKVVDFQIGNLRAFESLLDLKRKYLLHYAGADNATIDYQDDIDVFIIQKYNTTRQRGLYYHKNNEDAMRMVTHRDYSVVIPYIVQYVPKLEQVNPGNTSIDIQSLYVRLHIRKSGYLRSLVYENNRIHELYKLQDADIMRSMLGLDSIVPNWTARNLENSGYTAIMRSLCKDITPAVVQDAYGYNALSKVLNETPSITYSANGGLVVDVPYGFQVNSTAYEYDNNGLLNGYYTHTVGDKYTAINNTTKYVEFTSGLGGDVLDEIYDVGTVNLSTQASYRVYGCKTVNGIPDNDFTDITNRTDLFTMTNSSFTKLSAGATTYMVLRSDLKFLAYSFQLSMQRGELKFTLGHKQTRNNITSNWIMQVPLGELDVFLNKRSLIRGLDYFINFPEVVIINKEFLVNANTDPQNVVVRFNGFCNADLELTPQQDVGFIEHGVLSNNNTFDVRDDKVLRIISYGQLKVRQDLVFSELHSGVSILDAQNGKPYQIRDVIEPMRGLTVEETYSLREKSKVIDKRVSDYLSVKIPQPVRGAVSAISQRYQVFSPFICKLIFDLRDGLLLVPIVSGAYGRQYVTDLCKGYEYLLASDPTQSETSLNTNYVIIHPHSLTTVIGLGAKEYKFMDEVITYYANGLITLSPFVVIV